jgi:hypothetical protein
MDPASLGGFFLINFLLFPYAADCTAKSNTNIERHRTLSSVRVDDAYTADESHLC